MKGVRQRKLGSSTSAFLFNFFPLLRFNAKCLTRISSLLFLEQIALILTAKFLVAASHQREIAGESLMKKKEKKRKIDSLEFQKRFCKSRQRTEPRTRLIQQSGAPPKKIPPPYRWYVYETWEKKCSAHLRRCLFVFLCSLPSGTIRAFRVVVPGLTFATLSQRWGAAKEEAEEVAETGGLLTVCARPRQ